MPAHLPENDKHLSLKLTTPLGPQKLMVDKVHMLERLSDVYHLTIHAHGKESDIDFEKLMGKSAQLLLTYDGDKKRYFTGIIGEVRQGVTEDASGFSHYILTLYPTFWMARFNQDYRIFQNKSANDMCEELLKEYNVPDTRYNASKKGSKKRKYCTQYGESAFDFINRLWSEEGIFYFFSHASSGDTLEVHDAVSGLKPLDKETLEFTPQQVGSVSWQNAVQEFYKEQRVVSKSASLADYDFTAPDTKLYQKTSGKGEGGEVYRYPGRFFKMETGEDLNKTHMEQLEWNRHMFYGRSTAPGMATGGKFKLKNHPRNDTNQDYIVYEVEHFFDVRENVKNESDRALYYNRFTCFPAKTPFRPFPKPKPRIYSNQVAIVVGPSGEEIHTDEHGRIKVQFYWDQRGKNNEKSSCWVRVAHMWGGSGFGTMFIPRIDMEVVVSFLEGDPDRPLVVGSVYNGNNKPPYPLPDEKTKSTIKTQSSKNASDAYNEICFEDKKDSEQLYVRAQKDYDREVMKGDRTLIIHEGDDTLTIKKGNRTLKVDTGDEVIKIAGTRTLNVTKTEKHTVTDDFTLDVSNHKITIKALNIDIEAGNTINIKATNAVNIEGTASVNIKGGKVGVDAMTEIAHNATTEYKIDALKYTLNAKTMADMTASMMKLTANAQTTMMLGPVANINCSGALSINSSGVCAIVASGPAAFKGAVTKLG